MMILHLRQRPSVVVGYLMDALKTNVVGCTDLLRLPLDPSPECGAKPHISLILSIRQARMQVN